MHSGHHGTGSVLGFMHTQTLMGSVVGAGGVVRLKTTVWLFSCTASCLFRTFLYLMFLYFAEHPTESTSGRRCPLTSNVLHCNRDKGSNFPRPSKRLLSQLFIDQRPYKKKIKLRC